MNNAHDDPLGIAPAACGWSPTPAEHPNRNLDPGMRAWETHDRRLLLFLSSPRGEGHLIGLSAPRTPGQLEDPLWQIIGGPVLAQAALAMVHAATGDCEPGPAEDNMAAAGWDRAPDNILTPIAGISAFTDPAIDADNRFWSALLFPAATPQLGFWTIKGAHNGQDCVLTAAAETPASVLTAAPPTPHNLQPTPPRKDSDRAAGHLPAHR